MSDNSVAFADSVPRRRVRWRRGIAVFVGVVVLELLVVGVWAAFQARAARADLFAARADAQAARSAALDLDINGARSGFASAAEQFAAGGERLSGPVMRWLDYVPVVGDDLRATRALARGGVLVAEAALGLVATVDDMPDGLGSFAPQDGRLPTEAIAALAEPAVAAQQRLAEAQEIAGSIDTDGLLPQVNDAHGEFVSEVAEAEELVDVAHTVSTNLPGFLGADEPRRYLFAAQNPAELRGTGGFMGAYAMLTIDDGALDFSEFIPIQDLTSLPAEEIEPPSPDYAARYNRFGGAGFWQAINATPDFPTAATAIENLWEATEGTQIDGVIAVDPLAYEGLLAVSGPVDVPGFGAVGAEEVVEVVANEAYAAFEQDERKQILGAIAAGALQRALGGADIGPLDAAQAILRMARDGHLKIHAARPEEQRLLQQFDLGGALLDPEGDFLSVVANSASFTKLDYYIERSVDYRVQLNRDGSADAHVTVEFRNSAPTEGLPRHVIGPGLRGELEIGEQRNWVSVFCAVGCQPAPDDDWDLGTELGHGVVSRFITVESGETATAEATWHVPDAWDPAHGTYQVTYQGQTTLHPTQVNIHVSAPDGYHVENGGEWTGQVAGTEQIVMAVEQS